MITRFIKEFPKTNVEIYGIQENYLRTVNNEIYYPNEVDNIQLPSIFDKKITMEIVLDSGKLDAVYGLWSDQGLTKYNNTFDPNEILVGKDKISGSYKDKGSIFEIYYWQSNFWK